EYFANELRAAAQFLETHTGHKLDLDKLKSIIDESNKHYELWQEYNDLRRVTPVPYGWAKADICGAIAQGAGVGRPEATRWFQELVDLAERKVEAGEGVVSGKEEIRMLWWDLNSVFGHKFLPWLEEEYGAVVVMDWAGNHSYTAIDTSSEEEMWRGMAKRCLYDTPMIRQANGTADNMVNDLVRVVEDFDIDVVVWPGHMGHKDLLATYGIIREKCRELGVHFLDIRMDIWDERYMTADQIKDKFVRFFEAAGYA
ncbi:MAG: 2-hydroxyacyl-CoA dehydratase, partial [Dehalococcoidia bacterium]